jgi:hypothetical protein
VVASRDHAVRALSIELAEGMTPAAKSGMFRFAVVTEQDMNKTRRKVDATLKTKIASEAL